MRRIILACLFITLYSVISLGQNGPVFINNRIMLPPFMAHTITSYGYISFYYYSDVNHKKELMTKQGFIVDSLYKDKKETLHIKRKFIVAKVDDNEYTTIPVCDFYKLIPNK